MNWIYKLVEVINGKHATLNTCSIRIYGLFTRQIISCISENQNAFEISFAVWCGVACDIWLDIFIHNKAIHANIRISRDGGGGGGRGLK